MSRHNGGDGWGSAGGRGQRFGGMGSGRKSRGNDGSSGKPVAEATSQSLATSFANQQDQIQTRKATKKQCGNVWMSADF